MPIVTIFRSPQMKPDENYFLTDLYTPYLRSWWNPLEEGEIEEEVNQEWPLHGHDGFGRLILGRQADEREPFWEDDEDEDDEDWEDVVFRNDVEVIQVVEEEYVENVWEAIEHIVTGTAEKSVPNILEIVGRVPTQEGELPCMYCLFHGFDQYGQFEHCENCQGQKYYDLEDHVLNPGTWRMDADDFNVYDEYVDPDEALADRDYYDTDEDDDSEGCGFTPEFL